MASRRTVTSIIEVVSYLTVTPSTGPQRQNSVNQRLLVSSQRTDVERDRSAANNERFW